jgi:phosphoglycerate dehydrogenase-like enzyme
MSAIVLTQRLAGESRLIAESLAAPLGGFVHLDDVAVDGRAGVLAAAKVVMAFKPLKEMGEHLAVLHDGQLLQIVSAGLDDLPFDSLPPGVLVAGNSGAFARPMAEHALAMALCLAKRLPEEDAAMRRGQFNQMAPNLLLCGKKAAVLGLGGAGKAVAGLLRALGMEIFALNTSGRTDEPVAFVGTRDDLATILADAQLVVLTLPYTHLTHELIGAREMAMLRPDAILVNVARGEIIDQKALYEHLRTHPACKAGLESWWVEPLRHGRFELAAPLLDLPNLLASPHNSFNVPEWPRLALEAAFANAGRFLRGEPITGRMRPELHRI